MKRIAIRAPLAFIFLAAAIVVAAAVAFRSSTNAAQADILAWGFTFDLTLTIPFLYWLFIVRRGVAPPITIMPVFLVSLIVAGTIVPQDQQAFLRQLRYVAAPLEVLLIGLIARHLYKDRDNVAVRVLMFEVNTLYYAVCCWRQEAPPGFTTHKRTGWGSLVAGIILMIVAESIGIHLFLQQWSTTVAWIVTGLDIYGILWLIGDYHAIRLRPITIEDGTLRVRQGLRWSVDVPLDNIASIERITGEWKRQRDVMKLAILDEPELLIRLREPQIATGVMGIRREITAIAVLADEAERFEAAVRLACSRAATS